jgi:hypothetical protein
LFAALDTLDGSVIARCDQHHRHSEWLDFLRQIERETPKGEPRLEAVQQRDTMLLAQTVPVSDACFAVGQFALGERFDLIQRLEVFERLGNTWTGLVLLPLEDVGKGVVQNPCFFALHRRVIRPAFSDRINTECESV